ncbi:MAG: ABC transporter ATP-binding protein [Lautropia sp.]
MLHMAGIQAAYGRSQVLFDISIDVAEGEAVGLLGRNGMGKTTTLRALMGIVRPSAGTIRLGDQPLLGLKPHGVARAGIGYVPEGRQIFPNLTVLENLEVVEPSRNDPDGWDVGRVVELFPRLWERRENMGNQLSGGEQQMLAIGRALMTRPRLLVLDEATEGLAPLIRAEIWRVLARIRAAGQSILVVDKNLEVLLRFVDRAYIVEKGRTVWHGTAAMLSGDRPTQLRYLGV